MGDVLTPELVWADEDFENVLTLPLPLNPSCELLDEARAALSDYIDWVVEYLSCDGASQDELRRAIERATCRLLEIATHWPAAEAAHDAEIEAAQKAKEDADPRPDFEPPGEIERDESPLTKLLFQAEGTADRIEATLRSLPYEAEDEQRFLAPLLASRCLEMYKDKEGRKYRLDQQTAAAPSEAGPRETSIAGPG